MLFETVYMLVGNSTLTIKRQFYIPVNSIVAEHGVKFCENPSTAQVLTGCHSTRSLYRIGTCVANTKLQDLVGSLQHSKYENVDTCPFSTFVCPQFVWNKSKELFFFWTNYDISWPRQQTNLLHN
jgi:hypothetical protein